ncbi:MAG: hypothetical protein CL670_14810 [Balneola sp.]|jgi:hypothetical protein|nr:hypothetical protein [Balneola sp.]MBE80427.1 hypothetical protein [Balneola sp.]|tara:strand:- start:2543 stop:3187 length:645 start_codon:yes stop_codon:yes gene_type:complete
MSVIAYACLPDKILLASDGAAFFNNEITSTNNNKIIQVNSQVGMLWLGNMHSVKPIIMKRLEEAGAKYPEEVAKITGLVLKETVDEFLKQMKDKHNFEPEVLYNINTIGFNQEGKPELWRLNNSKEDNRHAFDPEKGQIVVGGIGCGGYDGVYTDRFGSLLKQELPTYSGKPGEAEDAVSIAFFRLVEQLKKEEKLVGGKLYLASIQHQPNSHV